MRAQLRSSKARQPWRRLTLQAAMQVIAATTKVKLCCSWRASASGQLRLLLRTLRTMQQQVVVALQLQHSPRAASAMMTLLRQKGRIALQLQKQSTLARQQQCSSLQRRRRRAAPQHMRTGALMLPAATGLAAS